jgi:nicotinamide-nucleotide amidase
VSGAGKPTASILAVGSELLGTNRTDTNSLYLTGELGAIGIPVVRKACSGDAWEDLEAEVRIALERAPLLVVTGGLGPTDDDRTKEVVARVFGRRLVRDEGILARLRERFARRGFPMPKVNEKQADVIEGAVVLRNPRGSAPGYVVLDGRRAAVLLPGVPVEMRGMWSEEAVPVLTDRFPTTGAVHRRLLKVAGMAESVVEERIRPVYDAFPHDPITILAAAGEIHLQFAVQGPQVEAEARLDRIEAAFVEVLGEEIFGRGDQTLEGVVGGLLREAGRTLAVAESCTGGTLAGRITDAPGASAYFLGGAVTYADEAKVAALGIRPATLERFGAVSEETARAMAAGIRARLGASVGIGVTGIAGPTGGTEEKPVGLVHVALDDEDGTVRHRRLQLPGDRTMVRRWTTSIALSMLRFHLLGRGESKRPWR